MRSNFWEEKNGVFEVSPGAEVTATIDEAINRAKTEARAITFEFNDVLVTVHSDSDKTLMYRDWQRALSGYIDRHVGPYPPARLSSEALAHDAEVEAAHEVRRKAANDVYEAKERAKREQADARLSNAASIELADEEGWNKFRENNRDGYGGAVVTYAERWARLMQAEMAEGKLLEDIAQRTSREADLEGITGFMYGCAVGTLAKVWRHGEALRRWHNLDTQIGNEGERANESGGVLNPTLLNIG